MLARGVRTGRLNCRTKMPLQCLCGTFGSFSTISVTWVLVSLLSSLSILIG